MNSSASIIRICILISIALPASLSYGQFGPSIIQGEPPCQSCAQAQTMFQPVAQPTFHALPQTFQQPAINNGTDFGNANLGNANLRNANFGNANYLGSGIANNEVYSPISPLAGQPSLLEIGGGRPIRKAIFDKNWTRMTMVYGGFGNNQNNGGDIFDGRADVDLGVVGIDIGRRHSNYLRSSIDFTARSGNISNGAGDVTGELDILSLMKNFHFDLQPRSRGLRPYVGVGLGFAYTDSVGTYGGAPAFIEGETSFAWQAIGGMAHQIGQKASLYAEYRYFSTADVDLVSAGALANQGNFTSHDFLFGLRFGY